MLLRRLFRLPVDDRADVAHGLRRLIDGAERRPLPVGVRSIVHPWSCGPACPRCGASTPRSMTRRARCRTSLHAALRAFLTDGATSPLYRRDTLSACLAAEALADRFAPAMRQRREAA